MYFYSIFYIIACFDICDVLIFCFFFSPQPACLEKSPRCPLQFSNFSFTFFRHPLYLRFYLLLFHIRLNDLFHCDFFLFRLVIWTYCLAILLSFPAVLYYIYVLVFNIWLQYFLPPMFYVILFYFHIAKFFYQVLLLCRRSCLLKGSS